MEARLKHAAETGRGTLQRPRSRYKYHDKRCSAARVYRLLVTVTLSVVSSSTGPTLSSMESDVLSKHMKPRTAPVKEGSNHLGFSRASELKQKQNTRPWRDFKREIWFVFVFQRLDGSLNYYPDKNPEIRPRNVSFFT